MDQNQQLPHPGAPVDTSGVKRKRSASVEAPSQVVGIAPPAKRTHTSTPNVNYLSRAYTDTLSLLDQRDSLRTTLDLLNDYVAVMERHESLASNLGAKPLGPMLMKRFERLFEERPRILKSNSKDNASVNWLDVVEFAKHKPEQFNLEKQRDGVKVCQFYTKQCRVEISEEDFQLISSGMPQKLIPPQPIPEDEEKELATIEILEKSVANIATLAEQGKRSSGCQVAKVLTYIPSSNQNQVVQTASSWSQKCNHQSKAAGDDSRTIATDLRS